MNARAAAFWDACRDSSLAALAFVLPLAVYLNTYDPVMAKEATLLAAAAFVWFSTVARAVEAGRVEWPANRTAVSLAAKAILALMAVHLLGRPSPELSLWPAIRFACFLTLYLVVVSGPASTGFAKTLSAAALTAAAAAGAAALLFGAHPAGSPRLTAVLCAAAVPLGLSFALNAERPAPARALPATAALLCALASARCMPQIGELSARWSFVPATAGRAGSVLTWLLSLWILAGAVRDMLRRQKDGDLPNAFIASGQVTAALVLLAASVLGRAHDDPAAGALYWMLLGSLAGLARERGAAKVSVVAIPAGPVLRRTLYVPAGAFFCAGMLGALSLLRADCRRNHGFHYASQGDLASAVREFDAVALWHPAGLASRYLAANLSVGEGRPEDYEAALARYADIERKAPHYLRLDYRKAVAFAKLHRPGEAEASLLASVSVLPQDSDSWRLLAEVESDLGKKFEAQRAAEVLVKLEPEVDLNWFVLAEKYQQNGRSDLARGALDLAAEVREYAEANASRPGKPL